MDISQQWRRRMTGFWMMANPMFGYRFRHLQKLHSDAFMGLNAVCLPETNPPGAVYRSSLPATPVSTPIWENHHYFSEQALRDRLCKTPSPRKCRLFLPRGSIPEVGVGLNSLNADPSCSVVISSSSDSSGEHTPVSKLSLSRESTPENDEGHVIPIVQEPLPLEKPEILKRKLFVGNISYRISKRELKSYFARFGKVTDCLVVHDHIKKRPKGYGFVTFEKLEDAENVLKKASECLVLDGRELRVFPAEEKRTSKLKKESADLILQQDDLNVNEGTEEETLPTLAVTTVPGAIDSINNLPEDVLLIIFTYLNIKEKVKIERVCKKWQILTLRMWQSHTTLEHWSCFSVFRGCSLDNSTLRCILRKTAPNLKKLDLSTASHRLDFRAMEIIAHLCPNLESVNLTGIEVTNVSLQQLAQKCPKLKVVIYRQSFNVGEKGFWWLLHLCKDLEYLDISANSRLTGQCFHMARSSLRTVKLDSCSKICPVGFSKLATKCQNLTSLYLNNCYSLTDHALELLCQSLKKLTLFHVGGNFLILSSAGLHHIGRLSTLEDLSLAHNLAVDDHVVCAISRGCRKLRILNLSGCHDGVTDAALRSISECPRLKTLYISYLDKVTDDGVSAVARQGQLQVLHARGCRNLGDKGFIAVALLCPSIRELDVSGCHNCTNLLLEASLERASLRIADTCLTVTVGGTSILIPDVQIRHPNLEICTLNLCLNHLRPDRVEDFGMRGDIIGEEELLDEEPEDACDRGSEGTDGEESGSAGERAEGSRNWPITDDMVEGFLTSDDPAAFADFWPS